MVSWLVTVGWPDAGTQGKGCPGRRQARCAAGTSRALGRHTWLPCHALSPRSAGDDWARMGAGDPAVEELYAWGPNGQMAVPTRGANGRGDGVHLMTGPIYICDAEPGDVLQAKRRAGGCISCCMQPQRCRSGGARLGWQVPAHELSTGGSASAPPQIDILDLQPRRNPATGGRAAPVCPRVGLQHGMHCRTPATKRPPLLSSAPACRPRVWVERGSRRRRERERERLRARSP